MQSQAESRRLYSIKEAVAAGWWPSESGLRWLVFRSAQNGLGPVIRRINGRVLLDEGEWWRWVDQHAEARS